MNGFRLADPWFLLLLAIPLAVLLWRGRSGGADHPGWTLLAGLRPSRRPLLWRLLTVAGLLCLAVAAARPQYGRVVTERTTAGRDLMLVIDLSGSMQVDDIADDSAEGRRSDRLRAVVRAARGFVERRPDDRIGLAFFADRAIASCPPTTDHATVHDFLQRTEEQVRRLWARDRTLLGNGTNLGLGLGSATRLLRDEQAKGRAVILITDGADSRELDNWVDPISAARHARSLGAAVHGIAVGDADGTMTQRDVFGRVQLARVPQRLMPDHARLAAIVKSGGGHSWKAEDADGLDRAFRAIDALEPTKRTQRQVDDFHDRWHWPLACGLALLALAFVCEPKLRGARP